MKSDNKYSSDNSNLYFAEIMESSLDNFTAQCWEWDFFPNFGSLVQVENKKNITFGVVTQIQTGSMDPMRYPFPYKKTQEELLREQPQIFEFLKTIFKVQFLGYCHIGNQSKFYYLLPPKPCKIHTFVKNTSEQTTNLFFSKPDYLNLLFAFSGNIANLDELLVAILNNLTTKKILDSKKLDAFCQSFSLLTGNDYRRLKLFLKRIEGF